MTRFIVLTFAFLAWGFWELSGGADFVPEGANQLAEAPAAEEPAVLVTRASSMTTSLTLDPDPVAEPAAASGSETAQIVPASMTSPQANGRGGTPEIGQTRIGDEGVYLFESLVEGAPTVADILPDSEIAVIVPQAVAARSADVSLATSSGDIRRVAGSRVNMRSGPGTNYGVVTTLSGGTDVEVFEVNAQGWARLRDVATGQEGWMAERLLAN